ncbi:uncharacterized protein LOC135372785 [Ornithodoros turicata]|uniref:uncharacterized protein LOC135372785 n=1 Tax=Ornithodoros turicata TaxID=34597 RepID=UPI003138E596
MKPQSVLSRFIRPRSLLGFIFSLCPLALCSQRGALLSSTREDTTSISETTAVDGDPQAISLIGGTQEETLSQTAPSPVTEGSSDGSSASLCSRQRRISGLSRIMKTEAQKAGANNCNAAGGACVRNKANEQSLSTFARLR